MSHPKSSSGGLDMKPLGDISVLDLSLTIPGPYATCILQDLGAEIISIEPPDGDPLRSRGPTNEEGVGKLFAALNEGKQCLSVDLKSERGKEFLKDLVSEVDVFVEGFRPGVVDRLGIGPDVLCEEESDLIYCSLSGYGQTGPRRDQPAHSLNYEGLAGFLNPDNPSIPGFPVADFAGAQTLVIAIQAAIRTRDSGGAGQYIDLGLYDTLASWNNLNAPWATDPDSEIDRDPLVTGEYPCTNTYETADGRFITLGIMEPKFWDKLCERVGRPELSEKQFEIGGKDSEAYVELQSEFLRESSSEWLDRLSGDLPVGPVRTPKEALNDEQLTAREGILAFDNTTGEFVRGFGLPISIPANGSPGGDTTPSTLEAAGYDDQSINRLMDEGVVSPSRSSR